MVRRSHLANVKTKVKGSTVAFKRPPAAGRSRFKVIARPIPRMIQHYRSPPSRAGRDHSDTPDLRRLVHPRRMGSVSTFLEYPPPPSRRTLSISTPSTILTVQQLSYSGTDADDRVGAAGSAHST